MTKLKRKAAPVRNDRIDPTPERMRQGGLYRTSVELPGIRPGDSDTAEVWQAEGPTMLDWMHEHGEIDDRQHEAGERYQRLASGAGRFRARAGGAGRYSTLPGRSQQSDDSAQDEMACIGAERAVGRAEGPGGVLALNALCLDECRVNPLTARRVLDVLATLFGVR